MATQAEIDYALMAGAAYRSTRSGINRLPAPPEWHEILGSFVSLPSGFEAVSFQKGNEIVISLAGTGPGLNVDWFANAGLATGLGSDQLRQAALYYCQVKEANPGAQITLTGHSLGGGLAALLGVFFNEKAVTFDQAPFANSATESMRSYLVSNLLALTDANQQPLYTSQQLMSLAPTLFASSFDPASLANSNVTTLRVVGEFTSSLFPVSTFSPLGPQTPLLHGTTDISSFDLHAQSLLSSFVLNDQFRQITYKLNDLLGMAFDTTLCASPTDTDRKLHFKVRLTLNQADRYRSAYRLTYENTEWRIAA